MLRCASRGRLGGGARSGGDMCLGRGGRAFLEVCKAGLVMEDGRGDEGEGF